MKCPFCGKDSIIIDSRQKKEYYYRRHECIECKRRFTTQERYAKDYTKPMAFIKKRITRKEE